MTDPISILAAALATGLAAMVAWLMWPRPPNLDGERWFKLMIAILLRGEVEARGGSAADWRAAVRTWAPYHPAVRFPERMVSGPQPGMDAHPAETELARRLAAVEDPAARWAILYDEEGPARDPTLTDPVDLPPDYDIRKWLATAGWDDLALWGAGAPTPIIAALHTVFDGTTFLFVHDDPPGPPIVDALSGLLPERPVEVRAGGFDVTPLERALLALPEREEHRFVLLGMGRGIQTLLSGLHASPGWRDRVLAVLSLGGAIVTPESAPWMEANFTHRAFDTERARLTPYMCLQWLDRDCDPPGAFGLPIEQARFPPPRSEPLVPEAIEVVDLGVLPADSDPDRVAKALLTLLACWIRAR